MLDRNLWGTKTVGSGLETKDAPMETQLFKPEVERAFKDSHMTVKQNCSKAILHDLNKGVYNTLQRWQCYSSVKMCYFLTIVRPVS